MNIFDKFGKPNVGFQILFQSELLCGKATIYLQLIIRSIKRVIV